MGLINKPSAIEPKKTMTALIYGQPGIGKTTLACSAPNPVLLDFDGGVNRVNGAHQVDTVQPKNWDDVQAALAEIREAGDRYATIVVDTLGKMLQYIEAHIKTTEPKLVGRDGTLSLKGYGRRKVMFVEFIKDVTAMGKNVIFVAHEKEDKRTDDIVTVRPEMAQSANDELMKELDLVGYMQAYGDARTIDFDPSERYYAKNACDMRHHNPEGALVPIPIPKVVDDDGNAVGNNNFICSVLQRYQQRQVSNREKTAAFEKLVGEASEIIGSIENVDDANNALKWVLEAKHVYNSEAKLKQRLHAAATALGFVYNKAEKCYVA